MLTSGTMAIYFFLVSVTQAAQDYVYVSACPQGSSEWQTEATRKNCQKPTPDYLCASIENSPGHYGEICTKYGLSPSGTCAVLNAQTHNLDSVPCEAPEGCPDRPYNPAELYNWPICFNNFYGIERTISTEKTTVYPITTEPSNVTSVATATDTPEGDAGLVAGIIIVVLLVVLVVTLVAFYILDKRNNWSLRKTIRKRIMDMFGHFNAQREESVVNRDEVQAENAQDDTGRSLLPGDKGNEHLSSGITGKEPLLSETYEEPLSRLKATIEDDVSIDGKDISWKLEVLQRYLVICLKDHVGIEELKEKVILFKSSLAEHFNEVLLEPLYCLQSWDDYEKIDLLVVYNLLRNVCEHIHPPKRGWDYKPDGTDLELGADIERVRLMWNRYCDGETVFEDLNTLYARMQERYGNITKQINEKLDVDQCLMPKDKISPSVDLKPECEVWSGIVIRKGIKSVSEILNESDIVICKGAIGCGKTTCLKYLDELYRGWGWIVKWKEGIVSSLDAVVGENEKILLCCDNLFGTYNRGVYGAPSDINDFLNHPVKDGGGQMKIVLAIHDHVLDELQKNTSITILKNKRTIVDLNELSDAEKMLIFKDQRKRGHCTTDPKCWFRKVDFESLKNALRGNSGIIGDPAITLLYCDHHDIFAKREATLNPLKTLFSLFQNISSEKPELFNILVYTMFIKTHTFGKEVQDWAVEKPFGLTTDQIQQNIRHLHGYLDVSVDGRTMKMKHDLLSIGLFHICVKNPVYLPALLSYCHFQMIEELLRPSTNEIQSDFSVTLDEVNFQNLISRIVKDSLYVNMINHPFMQNAQFYQNLKNACPDNVWKLFFSKK